MLNLHANVYAAPSTTTPGGGLKSRGLNIPTLAGPASGPPTFDRPLPVTFEAMQTRLLELPRCDCEPDGFFLVTGHAQDRFWRLNGHMHEHAGQMHRVELHGECPPDALDRLLRTLGWPEVELVFELVREGVTLREVDFRNWASAG